jgi:hypothetical protein
MIFGYVLVGFYKDRIVFELSKFSYKDDLKGFFILFKPGLWYPQQGAEWQTGGNNILFLAAAAHVFLLQ